MFLKKNRSWVVINLNEKQPQMWGYRSPNLPGETDALQAMMRSLFCLATMLYHMILPGTFQATHVLTHAPTQP